MPPPLLYRFSGPDEYEIGPQLWVPGLEKFAVQCTVVASSTNTAPLIPSGPRDWLDMSI